MPLLNPDLFGFVTDPKHFRSYGIKPVGWRECETANIPKKCDEGLTEATYSFTAMLAKDGEEEKEQLLTLTIPDLPFRSWCPKCDFEPPDEVKLITFAVDGYSLERKPTFETSAATPPKTPKLNPVNKLCEAEAIPILELPVTPTRNEFVLEHGIGREAWWLAPMVEEKSKPLPVTKPVEHINCVCAYLMAPRIKRV